MYAHHMDFLIRVWGLVMGLVDVFVVMELASFPGARKLEEVPGTHQSHMRKEFRNISIKSFVTGETVTRINDR